MAIAFQGYDSFASRESLEQLHRFLFILGTTHVLYSFLALALAVIKVHVCSKALMAPKT